MYTITWVISALDCAPSEAGYANVVKVVHWRCNGEDDGYTGTVYSTCSLPGPEGQFIAYEDLTAQTVVDWCWANGVNKDATEAAVQAQIEAQKNPPIVQPPLPWAQ